MQALPNFFPHLYNVFRDNLLTMEEQLFENIFMHFRDKQLGTGSHGTTVYRGKFSQREIAIKKVLKDYAKLVEEEISIMLKIDQHPNILRYFAKESDENFIYIGTELCECTLSTLVTDTSWSGKMKIPNILRQTTKGLRQLHEMNISEYLNV